MRSGTHRRGPPPVKPSTSTAHMDARIVLVIEDHEDERIILRSILEHFGYEVVLARSAADAAGLIGDRAPDLVILDLDLADADGIAADDLRRGIGRAVPVIAISTDDPDASRVREFGCDRFYSKPYLPRNLVREVDTLIGRGRPPNA